MAVESRADRFAREYGYSTVYGDATDEDRMNRTFDAQSTDRKNHEFPTWSE